MLSPEYLLRVSEGAEEIASALHTDIIRRIVERIMIRLGRGEDYILTQTDVWNLRVLQDAGYLLEDIQREIAKRTKLQEQEIREAMIDAGVKNIQYDNAIYEAAGLSPAPLMQSPYLMRLMERNYSATVGEWRNYTRTTAEAAQRTFINALDKAYNLTASGAIGYTQAVRELINEVASEGVTVTYPTGHVDTLETAALRAIRTGISQACGQITDARLEEMDWDIILTSSHLGARVTGKEDYTDHSWWQGKFYSRTGKDKRFPPFSVCGMGLIEGIHGINCRHSHGAGDGINNPFEHYDTEENRKAYEIQQRQRTLERRIRKTKREVMTLKAAIDNAKDPELKLTLEQDYQRKSALLEKQNKAYNDFCKENSLKRLPDRLAIAKWDRKQAAAATGAARQYESARKNVRNELKDYSTSMNVVDQNKHIQGTDNFDPARSTLTSDPQELYNLYAGKSEFIPTNSGKWSERERFKHTSDIGIYRDLKGNEIITNIGVIHYGKRKGWHIVPGRPEKEK